MLFNKRGQSTLEYAIIIAVVVAALISMQVYFKRGLQGKLKSSTDDIGEAYSPGQTTSNTNVFSNISSMENITTSGTGVDAVPTTNTSSNQFQTRSLNESVGDFNVENWP